MRKLARVAIVAITGVALAAAPVAAAYAGDNVAVAVNTKDGTSIFKLAFSIKHVMGDVVDESNAAVAYASCDSCRTVAVAIQVVLVMGDPSVVTPTNVALAINEGCTTCETLASAVQYVLGVGDGPVHFTKEARDALKQLREDLRDLLNSDIPFDELAAGIEALTSQLGDILSSGLITNKDDEPQASPTPEGTPATEPSPAEPSPAESPASQQPSEPPSSPASSNSPEPDSAETPAPQSSPTS